MISISVHARKPYAPLFEYAEPGMGFQGLKVTTEGGGEVFIFLDDESRKQMIAALTPKNVEETTHA